MSPIFFKSQSEFRKWLQKNHLRKSEVWVGMYKVHTGKPSVTWNQAVDEALCFGWIDSVVRRIDDESHMQRFTPRKKSSIWSAKNIKRIGELIEEGRVSEHGQKAFNERDPRRQNLYSSEQEHIAFTAEQERQFRRNRKAWAWFQSKPASYRRPATWWVTSAKREETRARRLATLIEDSAAGRHIKPFIARKGEARE
jgi:uncharacterized protein YdeI (YjbR/CyaY-like superfamily)